jgi:hypothetical protein
MRMAVGMMTFTGFFGASMYIGRCIPSSMIGVGIVIAMC